VSSEHHSRPSANGTGKRAGLVAVARKLGVSPSTVSNAYNRPDQLSAALRQRVLDTAAELGYGGPDPSARQLRRGRAGAIGVVFFEHLPYAFDDPAAVRFMHGVSDILDARELNMVLVPGPREHTHRGAAVQNAAVDAFIVHGLAHPDPLLEAALKRRLATVIVDSQPLPGIDFVGIDDHAAAVTATQHLIDLGHRRIGILSFQLETHDAPGASQPTIAPPGEGVNERRLAGCRHALDMAGLDQSNLTVEGCRDVSQAEGRARTHALLDHAPDITAVFAFSDVLALGAKHAAHDRGLSVSELSIVGFDDTAPAAEDLTSVHQPQRAKGRVAAEVVVRALEPDPPAPRHQLLPTPLITRGSSAPATGWLTRH
jgi:DNA-binding LacI/PurR family transcriptional regulator